MSDDFSVLKYIVQLLDPALVFVQDVALFQPALEAIKLDGVETVAVSTNGEAAAPFSTIMQTTVTESVTESIASIDPDAPAKYLFTSGSTGLPKGVINTHQMMCANLAMTKICRPPASEEEGEVVVDWLPWHHTFGGNANFNGAMNTGSTLYIDGGRPVPGRFDETIRNLREVSPTYYGSVPAAFALLAHAMESDVALKESFFRRLRLLVFGGAALPRDLYDRIQELAIETVGERIVFMTGYGTTETAPTIAGTYWITESAGLLGLPMPGVTLKLVPQGDVFEVRVKGPLVMPGYLKRPDLTAEAFDEEGFYITGDAARWLDADDPHQRDCRSPAVSPKTSNSAAAPGSNREPCDWRCWPPRHRFCWTPSSPDRTKIMSLCWHGQTWRRQKNLWPSPRAKRRKKFSTIRRSLPTYGPDSANTTTPSQVRHAASPECYSCSSPPVSTRARSPIKVTSTSGPPWGNAVTW